MPFLSKKEEKMKRAIVTGGSRGIGLKIVEKFREKKIYPIIWDIIEPEDKSLVFKKVDISSFEEVKGAAEEVGEVHILVNNAGITRDKLLLRMKEEDWDEVINVNLKGVFNCTYAVLPMMLKNRWGRIINITSVIGIIGNVGQSNYAASKAGIIGFTKSVAKEVASRNITCNAVAPGFIETDMTKSLPQNIKDKYLSSISFKKLGTPLDVANLVCFLASDEANYITGEVIKIDGGMGI
jgi:3-oxoacyl-[acyl-carrier protein] reductase